MWPPWRRWRSSGRSSQTCRLTWQRGSAWGSTPRWLTPGPSGVWGGGLQLGVRWGWQCYAPLSLRGNAGLRRGLQVRHGVLCHGVAWWACHGVCVLGGGGDLGRQGVWAWAGGWGCLQPVWVPEVVLDPCAGWCRGSNGQSGPWPHSASDPFASTWLVTACQRPQRACPLVCPLAGWLAMELCRAGSQPSELLAHPWGAHLLIRIFWPLPPPMACVQL